MGLRNFIVQDDEKIAKKVLKGVENIAPDRTELNLISLKFSANSSNNLLDQDKLSLSETTNDPFNFVEGFPRYEKQNKINMWVLEDLIQELTTNTYSPFSNLFLQKKIFSRQ